VCEVHRAAPASRWTRVAPFLPRLRLKSSLFVFDLVGYCCSCSLGIYSVEDLPLLGHTPLRVRSRLFIRVLFSPFFFFPSSVRVRLGLLFPFFFFQHESETRESSSSPLIGGWSSPFPRLRSGVAHPRCSSSCSPSSGRLRAFFPVTLARPPLLGLRDNFPKRVRVVIPLSKPFALRLTPHPLGVSRLFLRVV